MTHSMKPLVFFAVIFSFSTAFAAPQSSYVLPSADAYIDGDFSSPLVLVSECDDDDCDHLQRYPTINTPPAFPTWDTLGQKCDEDDCDGDERTLSP